MNAADRIVLSRGPWLTLADGHSLPRRGADMDLLGERRDLAMAVAEGRIAAIGPREEILADWSAPTTLDWGDLLVMPGFVDPHTHPVFNATRELEFEMRNQGRSYVEIAAAGGGIRSSVRSLREADEAELVRSLARRADAFLRLGTTTIEAKSGYGLSMESELASLRAIRTVATRHPLDMVPTFMGAHEIPDEYRDDREAYVRLLVDEMIPAVAADGLARFCDVFCEAHVFTVDESRRILGAARAHGLGLRLHADEIEDTGGAALAAELEARSADHLVACSDEGIARLADSGTVAVLLPGTSFFLNLPRKAPARKLIDAGVPVALATDFNPGSCHTQSMPMILTIACIHYGLTAAEAITAATVNAAASLGLEGDRGRLVEGLRADVIGVEAHAARYLPYRFGDVLVRRVLKDGVEVVAQDAAEIAS